MDTKSRLLILRNTTVDGILNIQVNLTVMNEMVTCLHIFNNCKRRKNDNW